MSLKLLLAEDDLDLREVITEALTLDGFDVTACESAEQAISCVMRHTYDIALLDFVMSGMRRNESVSCVHRESTPLYVDLLSIIRLVWQFV